MTLPEPFRPLNGMQQMMLRWEAVHPLNAVHLVELGEPVSLAQAQAALDEALATLSLGPVEFSRNRTQSRFLPASAMAAPRVEAVVVAQPFESALTALLDDHLNRPFATSGVEWPFRFLHVPTDDGRCYLGIVYRHVVSDSRGIQLIARCWLRTLFGLSHTGVPLSTSTPTLEQLFPRDLSWRQTPCRIREITTELWESLGCFRAPTRPSQPASISGSLHGRKLPLVAIKKTAKEQGVTVQDALFAALLEGLNLLLADEMQDSRRRVLSLYAAADIRREASIPLDATLGQFLGSITVRVNAPVGQPYARTAAEVARQTRRVKDSREHLAHASHLATMARLWDCFPLRFNRAVGPWLFPVMSLISNVNLTDLLAQEIAAGFVLDYQRFTGTGILTPMMTGLTTLGSHVNLTTTRHTDVFTAEQHRLLLRHVERRLTGQLPAIADPESFHAEPTPVAATVREPKLRPDVRSRVS